jgi:hypothetical protein
MVRCSLTPWSDQFAHPARRKGGREGGRGGEEILKGGFKEGGEHGGGEGGRGERERWRRPMVEGWGERDGGGGGYLSNQDLTRAHVC